MEKKAEKKNFSGGRQLTSHQSSRSSRTYCRSARSQCCNRYTLVVHSQSCLPGDKVPLYLHMCSHRTPFKKTGRIVSNCSNLFLIVLTCLFYSL